MKNFRKVLALILVVATLFSFVAMASAKEAKDYADYSEIANVIPVEVITALGITEGYDGKYHPADTIDRDEVAAMVARLRNGGKFDAALYVGAPNVFADVKGQWSEGYVTYCAQLGIINGLNETTFNPDGKITVVDTLKLLLCVLGYDAKLSGYVGPNYRVAVVRDADKMGLTDGIASADMFKEATRDQVALMFFNALKARLVYGYVSDNIVSITNSLLTPDSIITLPELTNAEVAYCNAVISSKTLGNVLNVSSKDTRDCFGRPGTTWTVGNWSKFFVKAADDVKTDGTNPFADPTKIEAVYHNGTLHTDFDASELGKGVRAEKYGNELVLIDTFMTEVIATSVRRGTATLASGKEIPNAGYAVGDVLAFNVCHNNIDGNNACAAADKRIAASDVLTCQYHCGEYIHANAFTVVKPETITVAETHRVTAKPENSYVVTADATLYYSKNLNHEVVVNNEATVADVDGIMNWNAKGKSWNVYRDEYGYIQYWCAVPSAPAANSVGYFVEGTNKAVMNDTYVDADLTTPTYTYTADVIGMDAVKNNIAITANTYETMRVLTDTAYANPRAKGQLAVYNAAGDIVEAATFAGTETYLDATNGELVGESYKNEWGQEVGYHFNANTQYLIRTLDLATGEYKYETGLGYKAVAQYVGKVVVGDSVNHNVIQYLDTDKNGIIDYVFVDAFYVKTTGVYAHVIGIEENIGVAALGNYFPAFDLYAAYVDGVKSYIAYYDIYGNTLEAGKLYQSSMQAINATYKDAPIYVALEKCSLVDLSTQFTYWNQIRIVDGQIGLYLVKSNGEAVPKQFLASEYNDELTIYVILDGKVATYTGTSFVEAFGSNEWFTGNATGTVYSVYAVEYPGVIKTLIVNLY